MIGMRMNAFNDTGLGEPEQDANTALIELDKGLRSAKTGEQCEAIVRFPRLFEKYPFPILINSSLLKLAEVFRTGSNFLRVWVLRVCQQSEKHLDKILNVDEFVRRIYSVIHSNDPVARALTLRTLGSVAGIIPERQQVHHSIRRSLDSHDSVEVEAAIYAAQMFAAQSKLFAVSMCSKISDMIRGQATPASMKLQLIPILHYPAVEFVRVTLSALSTLASATLLDVPQQVALLLRYLQDDPRLSVKRHALHLLHSLARRGAHLWPQGALNNLIESTTTLLQDGAGNTDLLIRTLDVIEVLSQNAVTCDANMEENSPLLQLCLNACYSPDPFVAVKAITILSRVACYCYQEGLPAYGIQDVISCLESLIVLLVLDDKHLHQLKACLRSTVKLCQSQPSHCVLFVDAIGSTLINASAENSQNEKQTVALCEALGAIGSLGENTLLPLLPDILIKLKQTSHVHTKVMLCTLLFQTVAGGYEWNSECLEAVNNVVKNVDGWAKYRIARSAARYGHHTIATEIFKGLKETVASEQLHFWLSGLELVTKAECCLMNKTEGEDNMNKAEIVEKLNGAIARYASACASLKAASTPLRSLQFPSEYSKLRCEFLQSIAQLLHSCISLCTAPPPAIAVTVVIATKDDLQRYGRVTHQLRKSAQDLKNCAENYQKLYQSAFDADPESLANIRALQEICRLLANSLERVCGGPSISMYQQQNDSVNFHFGDSVEMRQLARCCTELRRLAPSCIGGESKNGAISHLRVSCLMSQVTLLAGGTMRLPIPRYFFQTLQTTSIKLSVSPQPRVLGEPVSVPQGSQLALKVEGVLRHGRRASLFRSVAAVCISISTTPPSKINSDQKDSNMNELQQTVTPHRDFFACEFLLSLGVPGSTIASPCTVGANTVPSTGGQYQITASASILDKDGNVWKCGPRSTLPVRVHEEPAKRKLP
ncbi:INT7 protein, partial [Acromyrmex heyeri]